MAGRPTGGLTISPRSFMTEKVVAADDEVVEYVDAHNFAGLHQAPRQVDVVLARRHVAGRVIVRKNHTRSGQRYAGYEHLAGMHDGRRVASIFAKNRPTYSRKMSTLVNRRLGSPTHQ